MDEKNILDLKFLVEFSYSLLYVSNYEKMSCLLDNSFNKNYYEYSKIIYNTLISSKFTENKILFNNDLVLTNPFNRVLFVVQDKEALLKNISDKGYTVSQGSQQ
jgi:hypothetical protein